MTEEELSKGLEAILEKGFDQSFAEYSAATFSSYSYPEANLTAARMHALALRAYIQYYLYAIPLETCMPEFLLDACREVGDRAVETVLPNPDAQVFCRKYVEMWCLMMSEGK